MGRCCNPPDSGFAVPCTHSRLRDANGNYLRGPLEFYVCIHIYIKIDSIINSPVEAMRGKAPDKFTQPPATRSNQQFIMGALSTFLHQTTHSQGGPNIQPYPVEH